MDAPSGRIRRPLAENNSRVNSTINALEKKAHKTRSANGEEPAISHRSRRPVEPSKSRSSPQIATPTPHTDHITQGAAVARPNDEAEEAKRLSQASYESASSSQSKKNYKSHIGPWQLGKTLGKGSSARVRLCRHSATKQLAAVKIVNRKMAYLVQDSSLAALSKWDNNLPEQRPGEMRVPMAIEREVAILKLIEHPNIMKLYDIWENRSEIYLILEYIDQGDLFTFINTQGKLTEDLSLYFFRQMISAITYCHSFNICHRDLKPENILITANLRIKIADFGMAALHQTATHRLATACGSPHYAAPELLKNRQYRGDKADTWSMGVILYAMLSASLPFDDPDLRVMMSKTKKGLYHMPKFLSPHAQDLIRRMLQVNPDVRISLTDVWQHPLVKKYAHLDNFGGTDGQPPDVRKSLQYTPILRQDVDPQLLRQMRSLWHMFSEQDIAMKLTCDEANDQKAFYWLLYDYREKQLEDFKPEMVQSASDYHHLKPGAWRKRISTCQFAQPRADGHGRSMSRFTVISNAEETEKGTVQSYDPYRGSRILQPCGSQVSQARIIVHRSRQGSQASQIARMRSGSQVRHAQVSSSFRGHQQSSRGSLSSLRSSRQGTPQTSGPGLRRKRGVDFSHVRKRSSNGHQLNRNLASASTITYDATDQSELVRSQSPESQNQLHRAHRKVRGAPVRVTAAANDSSLFTEELRHFSRNIAKDCDEAFKSSLMEDSSIAGSLTDGDQHRETTPFSCTLDSTPEIASATELSAKYYGTRPLPPLPSDYAMSSPPMAASTPASLSPVSVDDDVDSIANLSDHVGKAAPPRLVLRQDDRRTVSAPVHNQGFARGALLPSINENYGTNNVIYDKARIVSAPPHAISRAVNVDAKGVEYLSQIERSIRIVDSPNHVGPVKIPKPLNVRKKSAPADMERSTRNEAAYRAEKYNEYGPVGGPTQLHSNAGTRKKASWFRRSSRPSSDVASSTNGVTNESTPATSVEALRSESISNDGGIRKKSFVFPFWKSNKNRDSEMSILDVPESTVRSHSRKASMVRPISRYDTQDSITASGREIDVKQNWLARLFRVKPAMAYICMKTSRKCARQEIVIMLRSWRKYGIKGIQVDKRRNIVFGQVGTKNFLDLREVAFAAEVMTVIEHGKKQPLSIIRFTQERGAASSFYKVVETMKMVFGSRDSLVVDKSKRKMMIKTLNS